LERADHAPSPLINGRIVTVADSKNHFLNSPDIRKPDTIKNQVKLLQQFNSPQDTRSLNSTKDEISDHDALTEEFKFVNVNLSGYNLERTVLSQLAVGEKNNLLSVSNVFAPEKTTQKPTPKNMKKALGVQGKLLNFISFEGDNNGSKGSLDISKLKESAGVEKIKKQLS